MLIQVSQQLSEPVGAMAANGTQLAVSVFRHQLEAIVVVVEFRLVTVGEYLLHGLPTLSKAAYHVLLGNGHARHGAPGWQFAGGFPLRCPGRYSTAVYGTPFR